MIEFINDVDFDIEQYQSLPYVLDYHKDKEVEGQYVSAGHSREKMGIHYCFETQQLPPSSLEIKTKFEQWYDNVALAVNLFQPGHYLPLHHDLYERYRSLFDPENKKKIIRIIVMLENSSPGQIIQIDFKTWGQWRSGQVFWWYDDTPHAFYNMSLLPRYALQVTGVVR